MALSYDISSLKVNMRQLKLENGMHFNYMSFVIPKTKAEIISGGGVSFTGTRIYEGSIIQHAIVNEYLSPLVTQQRYDLKNTTTYNLYVSTASTTSVRFQLNIRNNTTNKESGGINSPASGKAFSIIMGYEGTDFQMVIISVLGSTTAGYYAYDKYTVVKPDSSKFGYFVSNEDVLITTGMSANWLSSYDTGLIEYLMDNSKIVSSDPYDPAGTSTANGTGGGGGTGDFDDTSDTIGLPSLPTLSGLNTGFFTAFVPSASQMQSVSNYLWSNLITDILDPDQTIGEKIDALKKVVANPYDAIMGCSIVPVTPPTAGSKELKMYGLVETGISLPYASTRWVTVDCGTLNIHEFWGGYLDYSPYTKTTSLYLPYIGTVSIDIDLIMAKALQVVYRVDILSGICVAFVLVDGSVKFHYQGQCATQVPITNADYSSTISAGIGLIGNVSQVVGSAVTGGVGGGVAGAVAGAVGGAISQAPSIASNVMGAKPDIRSGGSIGSSAGILSVQRPYLIIERPKQSLPEYQNTFTGYPSNITANVGSLSGYTEFESINLDGLSLTSSEKDELETLLKGGVYL